MDFVSNYASCGLSPQTDGMPVIPKKPATVLSAAGQGYKLLCINDTDIYSSLFVRFT